MNEFDIIKNIFAPLSNDVEWAKNFEDDVAFIDNIPNGIIISTDTLVENTHFLTNFDYKEIAKKLVRVNYSDIIAKGCLPIGVFLNLSINEKTTTINLENFAIGLKEDLQNLCGNIPLLGGDTTKTNGPMVLTLTILGKPVIDKPIFRKGANVGDLIVISGNIGDAKIGLEAILANENQYIYSIEHYNIPKVCNIKAANLVANYANAAMDISDGLLGDAKKLAKLNNLGLEIILNDIPFSEDGIKYLSHHKNNEVLKISLASFGDDYQILMAISPKNYKAFLLKAQNESLKFTKIGTFISPPEYKIKTIDGVIDFPNNASYTHKIGS